MKSPKQKNGRGTWGLKQTSRFLKMKKESSSEMLLRNGLIKSFSVRFERFTPILSLIADFYCKEAKLVIELESKAQSLPKEFLITKDSERNLTDQGIKILRFSNYEIFHDLKRVLKEIDTELKSRLGFPVVLARMYS